MHLFTTYYRTWLSLTTAGYVSFRLTDITLHSVFMLKYIMIYLYDDLVKLLSIIKPKTTYTATELHVVNKIWTREGTDSWPTNSE